MANLSGIEKVAIVISSMNKDQADKILNMLSPEESTKILHYITKLNNIDNKLKENTLTDFANMIEQTKNK